MSRVLALVCLGLALSLSACEKKKEAPKVPASGDKTAMPKVDTAVIQQKAEELVADAKAKLEQVKSLVSEKKLDEADAILKKLEALKGKLPADIQKLVEQSRSALDTAKKAAAAMPH